MKRIGRVAALALVLGGAAAAQNISSLDRGRAQDMLRNIAGDVRKHYYDPKLRGFDFDARVREADEKIKAATSLGQAMAIVAWALDGLNDSHTYFIPPPRITRQDYGWRMQMVGERCYVTQVRPGSDAEAKQLQLGDEILSLNGYQPARAIFPKILYLFNILRPQPGLRLALRAPDGKERQLDLLAKTRQLKRVIDFTGGGGGADIWDAIREIENEGRMTRSRYYEFGEDLMIWQLPQFNLDDSGVRSMLSHARKHKALILDLRGNSGGSVETLKLMVGGFFDREIKIGDRTGRKENKPLMARLLGRDAFTGKLAVLVDSRSASAAELFARVVQLEKRGAVLGDTSSGLVMEGKVHSYKMGTDTVVFYAALITDADIVMPDGKSLEYVGVTPDERILPTAADLAAQRDPVMARAAELFGVTLSAEQCGKLFPYEWPRE